MGALLKLFTGNPIAMLYIAAAVFAIGTATGGAAAWTLNGWRLGVKVEHAERERDQALTQGKVLAEATEACSRGVDAAHKAAAGAVITGKLLLAEAQRLTAGTQNQVKRVEELLAKKPPPGADCRDAWRELEEISRKAGAAP